METPMTERPIQRDFYLLQAVRDKGYENPHDPALLVHVRKIVPGAQTLHDLPAAMKDSFANRLPHKVQS
jgi:hypothetical protein